MKQTQAGVITHWLWALTQHIKAINQIDAEAPTFKIVAIHDSKPNFGTHFTVQMQGKNLFPKLYAKHILSDKSLLNSFSEKDIEIIYRAAKDDMIKYSSQAVFDDTQQYLCKILSKTPINSETNGDFVYTISIQETNGKAEVKNYTPLELIHSGYLYQFSRPETFDIIYSAGQLSILKEQEAIQNTYLANEEIIHH